jgi:REP element-mobilizing transposase RayT
MARLPRIDFPGALYHVLSRGNHSQKIFRTPADYAQYCQLVAQYQARYRFHLYAYVLMPTHVHLLVETGRTPLAKIVQGLHQSYTHYFNRRYDLRGHLFQGRYKALLCQKDAYLLELVRYLHLNPVRAGLVRTPEAYRWSSHRIYLTGHSQGGVTIEPVLPRFGRSRPRAVEEYRRFIQAGRPQGHRSDLYQVTDQRILGDEEFVTAVARKVQQAGPPRPVQVSLSEVAAAVSQATGIPQDLLLATGRGRAAAQARALVAHLAREVADIPLTATAQYLRRDQATLSLGVRKLQERQAEDLELQALARHLAVTLHRGRRAKYKITNV